jgi:hypothetical protein
VSQELPFASGSESGSSATSRGPVVLNEIAVGDLAEEAPNGKSIRRAIVLSGLLMMERGTTAPLRYRLPQ